METKEHKIRFIKLLVALKMIKELGTENGTIKCPLCQGKLRFTVAKINGHVWGKCETDGCLSWMQ